MTYYWKHVSSPYLILISVSSWILEPSFCAFLRRHNRCSTVFSTQLSIPHNWQSNLLNCEYDHIIFYLKSNYNIVILYWVFTTFLALIQELYIYHLIFYISINIIIILWLRRLRNTKRLRNWSMDTQLSGVGEAGYLAPAFKFLIGP